MKLVYGLAGFIFLIVMWFLLLAIGVLDPQFIPWPSTICAKLFSLLSQPSFYWDLMGTLFRMFVGFVLAGIVGVSLGILIGYFRGLTSIFVSPVDFLRSVPATAMIPLFLFLLGIGDASKIGIVVFACSLINLIHALYGVQNVSEARLMMAAAFGVSRATVLSRIVLPSSLPHIAAGLRTTLSLSLILVVVAEMLIGTGNGIGQRIVDSQLTYRIPEMYALILALGSIGFAFNRGFVLLERRLLHWVKENK